MCLFDIRKKIKNKESKAELMYVICSNGCHLHCHNMTV